MEELIRILAVVVLMGITAIVKSLMRQEQGRYRRGPRWPGPVAGPGLPGEPRQPWSPRLPGPGPGQRPAGPGLPSGQQASRWAGQSQPGMARIGGEGVSVEGRQSEGLRSEGQPSEGWRSEGFGTGPSGSVLEERARFPSELERFRRARPETALRRPALEAEEVRNEPVHPLAQALATRDGLARAFLLSEVIGPPRAVRPYGME